MSVQLQLTSFIQWIGFTKCTYTVAALASTQMSFGVRSSRIHFFRGGEMNAWRTSPKGRLWGGYSCLKLFENTVNPPLSPPGGLFISSPFEGKLIWERGLIYLERTMVSVLHKNPSPFGFFYWPKWRIPTLSYTSAREISTRFYTWSLKKPLSLGASPHRPMWSTPRDKKRRMWPPEWTLLSNAYTGLCTDVPSMIVKKLNESIFIQSVRGV